MLYGGPCSITNDKPTLIRFFRTTNLTYMCKLTHNLLFNIVMHRLGSRGYVSGKDRLCMYKVMVGEKVNLPEVIFYYWVQEFKDKFNPKVKKNLILFGILFTQIMRNIGVDVSTMEPSTGTS